MTLLRRRSGAPSQTRVVVSTSVHRPCMIGITGVRGHACNTLVRSLVRYVVETLSNSPSLFLSMMLDMLTAALLLLPIAISLRFERIEARAKVVCRARRSLRRQSVMRQRKHL